MLRDNKGFTLADLLVMVAFIVILLVVTGAQLQAYNLQSFNAIAAADVRNAAAAEKMFFAEWGVYASSLPSGVAGIGDVFYSSRNSTGQIWANSISPNAPSTTIPSPGFQIGISQNVTVVINTSVMGGSYVLAGKNTAGDRCFAMDSDSRELHWVNGIVAQPLLSGWGMPSPVPGSNDLVNAPLSMFCSGLSDGSGQRTWVPL